MQTRSIEAFSICNWKQCMNWSSSEQIEYFSQIVIFFPMSDWHWEQQTQLKALLTVPFFLSVWPLNNAVLTNTIQSFSPRTVYQPERLSKLIMSLPFFSPIHLQTKKRDKGVSLTSRSLSASSCRSLPPAKRTFNKTLLLLDLPSGAQQKEHRI